MKIVDVKWRKPVSTYAISACVALVASVNSVNYYFMCTFGVMLTTATAATTTAVTRQLKLNEHLHTL